MKCTGAKLSLAIFTIKIYSICIMYDESNIFAKIIRSEIPCIKVYEDEFVLAFQDIAPAAPVHVVVIPKGQYCSFDDFAEKAEPSEFSRFFKAIRSIAHQCGLQQNGYRIVTNHGPDGGQTVFHFHVHILGGKKLSGL